MADSIIRLRVDSAEYDNKLKRASEGLTRYIDGCRKVGGTLAVVERETLQYVQSLGKMSTVSRSARGSLSEMTKTFTDLSMQYRRLTAEEKASPFGQALEQSLSQLRGRIGDTTAGLESIKAELSDMPSKSVDNVTQSFGTLNDRMLRLSALVSTIQNAFAGLQQLTGVVNEQVEAYKVQEEAELKLETVMRQRMKATDEEIDSIKRLASAQQEIGVIGDEVQLAGAQQVATFLNEKKSIETLLPAMNNLAVQRKGLNVTAEDMVNIGNLVGKVMQGNVGALTRVGVTFTEAEQQVLKYGNEEERAAMLAQVITNNVGQMNAVLAKTDAGKAKQMANAFGDQQEKIGQALAKYQIYIQTIGEVGMAASGFLTVASAIGGMAKSLGLATIASKAWAVAQSSFAAAGTLVTAVINGQTLSLTALRAGIRGTIVSLGLIGVAYAAVSTAVAAVTERLGLFGSSADDAKKSTDRLTGAGRQLAQAEAAAERAAKRNEEARQAAARSADSLTAKYETLRTQWNALKTDAEKTKWIEKNQSSFNALGMTVNNVNDAYNYFVKNSAKVVAALKAIAEADAYQDLYKDAVKRRAEAGRTKSVANGGFYRSVRAGGEYAIGDLADIGTAGLQQLTANGAQYHHHGGRRADTYTLSKEAAAIVNRLREQRARQTRRGYLNPYDADVDYYGGLLGGTQQRAMRLAADAGIDAGLKGDSSYTPQRTTTRTTPRTATTPRSTAKMTKQPPVVTIDDLRSPYADYTTNSISSFTASLKKALGDASIGSALYDSLTTKIATATGFSNLITEMVKQGLDPALYADTWQQLLAGDDVSAALDAMTAHLNESLRAKGLDMLTLDHATGALTPQDATPQPSETQLQGADVKEMTKRVGDVVGGLSTVSSGLQQMGVKLPDGVQKLLGAVQGAMSVIQGVQTVISVFSTSAIAANTVAVTANTAALVANAASNTGSAILSGLKTAASVAAVVALHNGGLVHAARGHVFGGNFNSGDLVPAMVNSGELVLNRAQQGNLASQLDGGLDGLALECTLRGEDLRIALNNNGRRTGRGEMVTARNTQR